MAAVKRRMYPKPLEFVSRNEELTFSEFEKEFGNNSTHIVMIKRGGRIGNIEFQKGQVLTLQAYSRNDRVVARPLKQQYQEYYGIPTGVSQQFIVIDSHGQEISNRGNLYDLLKKHKLPFRVMFPRNEFLKYENKRLNTSYAPNLELLYTFTENHFLANLIVNENAKDDIIYIPFHDSDVRINIVTEIKGMEDDVLNRFQEDIDRACLSFEYDMLHGNINVGVYSQDVPMRGLPITRTTPPLRFACFAELFDRPRMPLPAESHTTYEVPATTDNDDNVYDDIDDGYQSLRNNKNTNNTSARGVSHNQASTSERKVVPKVYPKPTNFKSILNANAINITGKEKSSTGEYENNIPRGEATPFQAGQKIEQIKTSSEVSGETNATDKDRSNLDISKLTIDEVCDYLKRLKLEKYIDKFREDLVDGKILLDVDVSVLETDFEFRKIEAIRLMNFVKDGHLPT